MSGTSRRTPLVLTLALALLLLGGSYLRNVRGQVPQRVQPPGFPPGEKVNSDDPKDYPDGHPLKAFFTELHPLQKPSPISVVAPGDDELTKLRKQRHQAARSAFEGTVNLFKAGSARGTLDILYDCLNRLIESELVLTIRPEARLTALERKVNLTKGMEWVNKTRYDAGQIPHQDFDRSTYERLDAEIKLLEFKHTHGAKK